MTFNGLFSDDLNIPSPAPFFVNDDLLDVAELPIEDLQLSFLDDTWMNLPSDGFVSNMAPSVPMDGYSTLSTSVNVIHQNVNDLLDDPSVNQLENNLGFDQSGIELFDWDLWNQLDELASIPNDDPTEQKTYKSSNTDNSQANFLTGNYMVFTGGFLQCIVPPSQYQRVRYVRELENDALRYMNVDNDGVLTLSISEIINDIPLQMSCYLRISRLTLPDELNGLQFYHPYGIWLNEEHALVHHNALLLPMNTPIIQIKKLVLPRLRQNILKQCSQYRIYTPNQFDDNNFHPIDRQKASAIINKYQLRCSVLHFQVVMIEGNNCVYPTDLQTETAPIYEYEGKEMKDLVPLMNRTNPNKCQAKKRSRDSNEKKMVKKKPGCEGPPPLV